MIHTRPIIRLRLIIAAVLVPSVCFTGAESPDFDAGGHSTYRTRHEQSTLAAGASVTQAEGLQQGFEEIGDAQSNRVPELESRVGSGSLYSRTPELEAALELEQALRAELQLLQFRIAEIKAPANTVIRTDEEPSRSREPGKASDTFDTTVDNTAPVRADDVDDGSARSFADWTAMVREAGADVAMAAQVISEAASRAEELSASELAALRKVARDSIGNNSIDKKQEDAAHKLMQWLRSAPGSYTGPTMLARYLERSVVLAVNEGVSLSRASSLVLQQLPEHKLNYGRVSEILELDYGALQLYLRHGWTCTTS